MSSITKIAVAAGVAFAVFASAVSWYSAAKYGNSSEVRLEAMKENNENILAQYGQKLVEIAQVPGMARDDIVAVAKAAIGARMGPDGSKATWQWIKEQNPSVDPGLYRKVQQIVEEGRNKFENSQTEMIEVKRSYRESLGSPWRGFWLGVAGYPKIDLNKFKAVTTGRAKSAFETGVEDGPIILNKR